MSRKLLIADLLCGAGGSSTGCARALRSLGYDMELVCLNHWPTAIETHQRNHPEARHYCQDIATVRPHIVVPEGYLDLLMASPSCTHHSVARGGKPTSDQQRSDPWHIIPWFTELQTRRAIIENVWEFTKWCPVDPATGRPIKSREGEYFRAWVDTIWKVGATSVEWRKLNAANYGAATTRLRFIMKVGFEKIAVGWAPITHQKVDAGNELQPGMKRWRPAHEIIDWDIPGKSIYSRKKPLAAKTLQRILAGVVKFGWPEPFVVVLRNHMSAQGVDAPLPTIAANGTHIGLAQPIILSSQNSGAPRAVVDPIPTVTTGGAGAKRAGCAMPMLIEPFVLSRHAEGAPRSIAEPTPTQVAKHSHVLISPYYGSGSGETCSTAENPLPTVTAKARFGLVIPVTHADRSNRARDVKTDPLPTLTTARRGELAFIAAAFGERPGQSPRVHDVDQPSPTVCATGRVNLIEGGPEHDILFRMLEPHELAAAMGFNRSDDAYEFVGTKTEQVKQIGNAVPVELMEAEVRACFVDETAMAEAAE